MILTKLCQFLSETLAGSKRNFIFNLWADMTKVLTAAWLTLYVNIGFKEQRIQILHFDIINFAI